MLKFILIAQLLGLTMMGSTSHPFVMGLLLIILSTMTSALLGLLYSTWLSSALVLVFLGGMMVVFLYFTSLSNNEKLISKHKTPRYVLPLFLMTLTAVWPSTYTLSGLPGMTTNFTEMSATVMMFLVAFLLLLLLVVVELCEGFKGSLEMSWF